MKNSNPQMTGSHARVITRILMGAFAIAVWSDVGICQTDNNAAPINYESTEPNDRVSSLIQQLENGSEQLDWDKDHGWLPALLDALEIPASSQTLVFSKTSQQHNRISPSSPRALYFNDDVYLGFVRDGDFLEIAAVDPVQGAIFYKLDQLKSEKATIERASSQCLSCHESHKTKDVPGFLVRSVFPKTNGHPEFRLGTTHTDHTTPMKDRFGGWYVTGTHGEMRHRGNVFVDSELEESIDREDGANLSQLPKIANGSSHFTSTSDIVALMLLEHQTQFHNCVTQASYTTRQALHHQTEMNKILEREADYRSDTTVRRITSVAEELVEYTLFCNEFQLTSPVAGNSEFTSQFAANAIRTEDGRSLRDLDLQTRMLRYPCSYLIYSDSFNSLPEPVLTIVKSRMLEVLTGKDESGKFQHLSAQDKQNILEILSQTHPLFK